jgi:hypothetical protein
MAFTVFGSMFAYGSCWPANQAALPATDKGGIHSFMASKISVGYTLQRASVPKIAVVAHAACATLPDGMAQFNGAPRRGSIRR